MKNLFPNPTLQISNHPFQKQLSCCCKSFLRYFLYIQEIRKHCPHFYINGQYHSNVMHLFKKSNFILFVCLCWIFIAVWAFLQLQRVRGYSPVAVCGFLTEVSCLVAEHGLWSRGSIAVAHGLSCFMAYRMFLDQGSNLCLLHWQADSLPLSHQGSSGYASCFTKLIIISWGTPWWHQWLGHSLNSIPGYRIQVLHAACAAKYTF